MTKSLFVGSTLWIMAVTVPTGSSAAAASGAVGASLVSPAATLPSDGTSVKAHYKQALGHNKVDGDAESRTVYRAVGATAGYSAGRITIGVDGERLTRDVDNPKTAGRYERVSNSATPQIEFRLSDTLALHLAYRMTRTTVDNSLLVNEPYDLDAARTAVGARIVNGAQTYDVTFASESLAEKEFLLYGSYPMKDKDYVPAQLDFRYTTAVTPAFDVGGLLRYSHYNADVYKEYEGDVPKTPTFAQVLDYLLTFELNGRYRVNNALEVAAGLQRKAALDVDTYSGAEYVVGYTGMLDVVTHIGKAVSLGGGIESSKGAKTHEVDGVAYDYASRLETYKAYAVVLL